MIVCVGDRHLLQNLDWTTPNTPPGFLVFWSSVFPRFFFLMFASMLDMYLLFEGLLFFLIIAGVRIEETGIERFLAVSTI